MLNANSRSKAGVNRRSAILSATAGLAAVPAAASPSGSKKAAAPGASCSTPRTAVANLTALGRPRGARASVYLAVTIQVAQSATTMPYVNLQITTGATREQKAELVRDFTASLVRVLGKRPEHTHIVIQEIGDENWGFSGMLTDDWKRTQ